MPEYTVLDALWPVSDGMDVSDINPYLPTMAEPGTFEKLRVLYARAKAEIPLFHPDDAEGNDESCRFEGHLGGMRQPQSNIPKTPGRIALNPIRVRLPR